MDEVSKIDAKQNVIERLQAIFGEKRVLSAHEDLVAYESDETRIRKIPDYVVFPKTAQEVSRLMALANELKIPVVPRGGGSGLTGGAVPVHGGILCVMTKMDRIIEIDKANLIAIAEPGIILETFQKAVEKEGLFYPPDPNSLDSATLGGTVAECAGGPRSVKYGVTRDYVLGLEVVLPTGEIISTGRRVRKDVAGYDLTRLIIGSEGTLGIVTKVMVRLISRPRAVGTMVALFPDFRDAARAVSAIMTANLTPSCLEFLDALAIHLVRDYLKMTVSSAIDYLLLDAGPSSALLLIEADDEAEGAKPRLHEIQGICKENRVGQTRLLSRGQERDRIWTVRRSIKNSIIASCALEMSEDIVVPIDKIPEMTEIIRGIATECSVDIINYGHFGDGNIHVNVLSYGGEEELVKRAERALDRVFEETIKIGGTITGEHGVGVTKAKWLPALVGDETIALYRRIKKAFDPNNILNPGKMCLE